MYRCGELLRPKSGDCCVFCSYGLAPLLCPPIQERLVYPTPQFAAMILNGACRRPYTPLPCMLSACDTVAAFTGVEAEDAALARSLRSPEDTIVLLSSARTPLPVLL